MRGGEKSEKMNSHFGRFQERNFNKSVRVFSARADFEFIDYYIEEKVFMKKYSGKKL